MEGVRREGVDAFDGFDSTEIDWREGGRRVKRGSFERSERGLEVVVERGRKEVGSCVEIDDGREEFGLVKETEDDALSEVDLRRRCDSLAEVVVPNEIFLVGELLRSGDGERLRG